MGFGVYCWAVPSFSEFSSCLVNLSSVISSFYLIASTLQVSKSTERPPEGVGVLPYKGLMGTCGQAGYVFRDFCLRQGIEFIIFCLNQGLDLSIFVLNNVSVFVLNRISLLG